LLLENKAEITGKNRKDQNILHLLAGNNALFESETVELLEMLSKSKGTFDVIRLQILIKAPKKNDNFSNLRVDFPSLIAEVDEEGATPLLQALISFKNYSTPTTGDTNAQPNRNKKISVRHRKTLALNANNDNNENEPGNIIENICQI